MLLSPHLFVLWVPYLSLTGLGPQNMCPIPVCQLGYVIQWPFLVACTLDSPQSPGKCLWSAGLGSTESRVLTSEVLGFILPESRIVGLGVLRSRVLW